MTWSAVVLPKGAPDPEAEVVIQEGLGEDEDNEASESVKRNLFQDDEESDVPIVARNEDVGKTDNQADDAGMEIDDSEVGSSNFQDITVEDSLSAADQMDYEDNEEFLSPSEEPTKRGLWPPGHFIPSQSPPAFQGFDSDGKLIMEEGVHDSGSKKENVPNILVQPGDTVVVSVMNEPIYVIDDFDKVDSDEEEGDDQFETRQRLSRKAKRHCRRSDVVSASQIKVLPEDEALKEEFQDYMIKGQ